MDGTLLDTLDDLTDSVNFILMQYRYPQRTRQEIKDFVGNGVVRLIKSALPQDATEKHFSLIVDEYKEYYRNHSRIKTRPYDGIMDLLGALKERNIKMAIVSNKPDAAVQELAGHYFGDLLAIAIGHREGIGKKPAPDMVEEAMRLLGADKKSTLYMGDSEVDKETAENTGIDCVLADWGFRDRIRLEELNAKGIISHPSELLKFI